MNPEQAKVIIEKLIEEHGPDCGETGHVLVVKGNGEPMLMHKDSPDAMGRRIVCDVGKGGMKKGFTAGLWHKMGDLLSKAANEAAGKG